MRSVSVDAFTELYGPAGDWVRLFELGEGYIRTELYRDSREPNRFVTVDHWESKAHLERFRAEYADRFAEIDRKGESLTESERLIGEFTVST